jgi:hypothetical protein
MKEWIIYELKQNVHLADGSNEWYVLGSNNSFDHIRTYAIKLVSEGKVKKEDLAALRTTKIEIDLALDIFCDGGEHK